MLKKCFKNVKLRIKNKPVKLPKNEVPNDDQNSPSCPKNKQNSDNIKSDSSSIKYIQILFYYVQDASLFKVHLPDKGHTEESLFVQVIQFSPDVLAFLITEMRNVCFTSSNPALTKVLFKFIFGQSLMLLFLLVWLTLCILSKCRHISSAAVTMWNTLKHTLCQAYLFALLFSYQTLIAAAFTLVQCVDVGQNKVLYIQGDIQCYTWWQIITQIYIFGNIIPILLVLSVFPFHVKDKTMFVRAFILMSVLPVPVICYFLVIKYFVRENFDYDKDKIKSIDRELADEASSSFSSNNPTDQEDIVQSHGNNI